MLLHIGGFRLDLDSQGDTIWHHLIPQTRVLCAVLFVFAIALTPNGRWWTWATYGAVVTAIILVSRVSLVILLKRVAVEFVFVGVVIVGTLFRGGGTVLWHWGWLRVTSEGLTILGSVSIKAFLSLLVMNLLILTTSVPALLHALAALRTPPLLVAILASMYRYIAVLAEEFSSMQRAARSRNLLSSRSRQRTVVGNMFGSLFIRTYERGERVHQAMLARGYEGLPRMADVPQTKQRDSVAITTATLLALLGQAIYLF